jgi:ribose transport system ATP-binding protein
VNRGQIVALMGANGAGKSTFVKILTGALKPDAGQVRIKGRDSTVHSPAGARQWGLVPVYQEPSLIPDLTVADNLRLGDTPVDGFRHWVNELGISSLRMDDMIGRLPLATLRILDLARALAVTPDVLMLDEMTAALPTDLVDRVLKVVRAEADAGRAVIYISHRFTEIAAICDRATVLRDGQTIGDLAIEPGIEERVVELMLGGKVAAAAAARGSKAAQTGTPRLRVRGLATGRPTSRWTSTRARFWASSPLKARGRTSFSTCWPATAAPPPGQSRLTALPSPSPTRPTPSPRA